MKKSRIVAILLALILGGIGMHKFYLNKNGQGILYLLFFWTLIPGIIALFDAIILMTTNDEKFNKQYNERSS